MLLGIHGPGDPHLEYLDQSPWMWENDTWNTLYASGVKSIIVLVPGTPDWAIKRLIMEGFDVTVRVFHKFVSTDVPDDPIHGIDLTPTQIAIRKYPYVKMAYDLGVRKFIWYNEPNVHTEGNPEGMWVAWQNGAQFAEFFNATIVPYRYLFPDMKILWPAVSPGSIIPNVRVNSAMFLEQAEAAIYHCDEYCLHQYWKPGNGDVQWAADTTLAHADEIRVKYGGKLPVNVTEYSIPTTIVASIEKARQYAEYCNRIAGKIDSAYSYILRVSGDQNGESWLGTELPFAFAREMGLDRG